MSLNLNQELQNKYPNLDIHIANLQKIDKEYLIFGSDFNGKSRELSLLSIKSDKKVSDYFDLIFKTYKNTNEKAYIYDLTHSLGNFLQETELNNDLGSGKKLAIAGDFIISRLRSYLKEIAVVQPKNHKQFFSTEYLIYRPKTDEISSSTLLAFSLSNPVQNILNKSQYGTEHPRFYEFVFNEMPIPNSIFALNNEIDEIMKNAYECLEQSKTLYREAEVCLYRELGLDPENPLATIQPLSGSLNISVRPLSQSLNSTGRLDSEYYQQKYDEIERVIKNYQGGYCKLKDIVVNRSGGFAFSSDSYLENGKLALVRINNIKNASLDLQNIVYLPDDAEFLSPKDKICKNDILISMSGSIGLCCVIRDEINAMVNQRILKISVSKFEENVLCLIINSICCKLQLQKIGTGGVQTNISGDDILNIIIPKINPQIQTQIADKVGQSFALRQLASKLLETAKQKVEQAIEA